MTATKIVSYSELDTYRQCALKHQLGYVERWTPPTEAPALSRGKLFHSVLETHYKALMKYQAEAGYPMKVPGEAVKRAKTAIKDLELLYDPQSGVQTEEQALVEWVYEGYVELYGADEQWRVLEVENQDALWLPTERGTRSTFKLKVRIDLVVQDYDTGGGIWIVDHKTCRNLPKDKELDLDDQLGIYTFLKRRQGLNVRGAYYDACRTERLVRPMTHAERFLRRMSVRTEKELETVALEALELMREAYRPRVGRDAPRSPNPDTCRWKCGFTEPCLAGRKGSDTRAMLTDLGFQQDFTRH